MLRRLIQGSSTKKFKSISPGKVGEKVKDAYSVLKPKEQQYCSLGTSQFSGEKTSFSSDVNKESPQVTHLENFPSAEQKN